MILDATSTTLYSTLAGGTALTALLAGTTSVYDTQAPDEATFDYVVFSLQAGGPELINPSDMENNLWFVRAYSTTSMKTATAILAQIDALLHKKTLSISGGTMFWCAREENLKTVDNLPSGEKAWMAGGLYRIRTTGV